MSQSTRMALGRGHSEIEVSRNRARLATSIFTGLIERCHCCGVSRPALPRFGSTGPVSWLPLVPMTWMLRLQRTNRRVAFTIIRSANAVAPAPREYLGASACPAGLDRAYLYEACVRGAPIA